MKKKTLVLGASLNPERFSYMAVRKLKYGNIPVVAVGLREGEISGVRIEKPFSKFEDVHTITIYIGPKNLIPYYDYIRSLKPKRVIFNPGTESPAFGETLSESGIEVVYGCTLIMISNNLY
ncbi:MAG: CoA-binding protein [Bacteroidota bacterium]